VSGTIIVNARLVNEGREFEADLRIEHDRIAEIGNGLSAATPWSMRAGAGCCRG